MKTIIPEAALGQHVACIGMTGSGKSYLSRGIVENLLDLNRRVCIIDYTGVWYGLRSNRTGKSAAYPVIIFGGEHADVPLNEHAGPALAKLVANGNRPCIIDVDGMTVGAQQRFVTAFLEELYRVNSKPLHLVMEEIDEFAPQTGAPGAERMIGAVCRIFQRGRRKGFRAMAITQRPANVHKRVLTQCKTLVALQLNAPQDRGAVLDWIRGHADLETGKAIVADLPKLQIGQGYVWAPQQQILEKVTVPAIRTFDSMRAPEDGEDSEPANWAEVDLEGIKAALGEAVKEAEANDPKLLRAEISRLQAELRKSKVSSENQKSASTSAVDIAAARQEGREEGAREGYAAGLRAVQPIADRLGTLSAAVSDTVEGFQQDLRRLAAAHPPVARAAPAPVRARESRTATETPRPAADLSAVGSAKQRILDALAWLEAVGIDRAEKVQLALLADQSPKSSGYANNLGALRSGGLIDYPAPAQVALTAAGRAAANAPGRAPTTEDLHRTLENRLDNAKWRILKALISYYPDSIGKGALAAEAGQSASSSGYANNLGALRSLGFIDYPKPGDVVALPVLFLER